MEAQIRPQDLRIGNVVIVDNPKYRQESTGKTSVVIGIELRINEGFPNSTGVITVREGLNEFGQFNEFLKPIPLTEDMLLMMGFEYYKPLNHYRIVLNDVWYEVITKDGCWVSFCNLNADESQWMPRKRIQYVLQNLFYALTDQELTIKQ